MDQRIDETAAERAWFARLAELAGTPAIDEHEAGDVLDLARVVAHTAERRFAPLSAYVAGLALAGAEPAERRERLRALVRDLQEQAVAGREGAGPA